MLLTIGALVVALGFSLAKTVGGSLTELGALEAIGAAIMFAGFLSLGRFGAAQPARTRAVAGAAAGPGRTSRSSASSPSEFQGGCLAGSLQPLAASQLVIFVTGSAPARATSSLPGGLPLQGVKACAHNLHRYVAGSEGRAGHSQFECLAASLTPDFTRRAMPAMTMVPSRWREGLRPPAGLMASVQWVLLAIALIALSLALLIISFESGAPYQVKICAFVAIGWLVLWLLSGYRLGRFPLWTDLLAIFALFVVGVGSWRSGGALGVLYAALYFRAFYASPEGSIGVAAGFMAANLAAVGVVAGSNHAAGAPWKSGFTPGFWRWPWWR